MLARRLTTILPAMTLAEALETTRLHRIAGRTTARTAVVTTRPCRAPHQTISDAGLIGGGHIPMPGEVSRAHHSLCRSPTPGPCLGVASLLPNIWHRPHADMSNCVTVRLWPGEVLSHEGTRRSTQHVYA